MEPVPIAIVGVGFRFPGSATDSDSFWDLLVEERVTWSKVPENRFNERSFNHPERGAPASFTHRGGHFLDQDFRDFDATFFRMPADQASSLDPQQRQLLETTYECVENAGITLESLKGSKTGVFIASFMHDFENLILKDSTTVPKYSMTGSGLAMCSNRISYFYDLHGPSLTLDTGCSGGLTAVHQGCQSLRFGEVDMSLVGAANVIINPDSMFPLDLSQCFSFDSRGTGYGRSEGTAVLALKRLDDAVASRDHIRAVIRHSVVSQDGRTRGVTMPNPDIQAEMIARAYRESGLDPGDTVYVEAHGTGTAAGDEAEIAALKTAFCGNGPRHRPLLIGSVKANMGHLEATSGLAGLIKSVLILERGFIPGCPDVVEFKENLGLSEKSIQESAYRLSINSFGYGGSNAHIILESSSIDARLPLCKSSICDVSSSISSTAIQNSSPVAVARLLVMSGQSENSLRSNIQNLLQFLRHKSLQQSDFQNILYTFNCKRTLFDFRRTIVAATTSQLIRSLREQYRGTLIPRNAPCVVFIFTGQGAQWSGMANTLLSSSPKFRASLDQSNTILQDLGAQWDLITELTGQEHGSRLFEPEIGQACCTSVQIALVDLYRECGLVPNYVLGHSSGEISAAYSVGVLTRRQALEAAYYRGRSIAESDQGDPTTGAMLAVQASASIVAKYLQELDDNKVSIACYNSRTNVTISGSRPQLELLQKRFTMHGIPAVFLKTKVAYHSPYMQAVAPFYQESLKHMVVLKSSSGRTRLFSSVTGQEKLDDFGHEYWVQNLISPVKYSEAVAALLHSINEETRSKSSKEAVFLEVGPHRTLMMPTMQMISDKTFGSCQYLASMIRGKDCRLTCMEMLSKLIDQGVPINLDIANQSSHDLEYAKFRSDLPTYAWDHSTVFWKESTVSRDHRLRRHPYHDLLGLRVLGSADIEPTWRSVVSVNTLPWLKDHVVDGKLIFPGAGYLAMALEAKRQILSDRFGSLEISNFTAENVTFHRMLEIDPDKPDIELQISLRYPLSVSNRAADAVEEFRIISVSVHDGAVEHASGLISAEVGVSRRSKQQSPSHIAKEGNGAFECLDMGQVYSNMHANGHLWGPSFACINSMSTTGTTASGTVVVPDIGKTMPGKVQQPHVIHPATLDSFLHAALMLFARNSGMQIMFPVSIQKLRISSDTPIKAGESLCFECKLEPHNSSTTKFSTTVFHSADNEQHQIFIEIETGLVQGTRNKINDFDGILFQNGPFWVLKELEYPKIDGSPIPLSSREGILDYKIVIYLDSLALQFLSNTINVLDARQIAPRYRRYLDWMMSAVHDRPILQNFPTDSQNLVEKRLLSRLGNALPTILTGSMDPFHLLYEDDLLTEFYDTSFGSETCYTRLATLVMYLAFKNPRLRILEIGAGTGALAEAVLSNLQEHDLCYSISYDFTDVSSGFFDTAKKRLSAWSGCVEFRKFDLNVSATEQGFKASQYDLVVAANALHVTASIPQVLEQIKMLLTPGGTLAFIEITKLATYVNSIFGLFPGWYQDWTDGRNSSPTVSVGKWHSFLAEYGYVSVEHSSTTQDIDHQMSVFVGRNPDPESIPPPSELEKETIEGIHASVTRLQRSLDTLRHRQSIITAGSTPLSGQNNFLNESRLDDIFTKDDTIIIIGPSLDVIETLVSALRGQGARHFILLSEEVESTVPNFRESTKSSDDDSLQIFGTKKPGDVETFCKTTLSLGPCRGLIFFSRYTQKKPWTNDILPYISENLEKHQFRSVLHLTLGITAPENMAQDFLTTEEIFQRELFSQNNILLCPSLVCLRISSVKNLQLSFDPPHTTGGLTDAGTCEIDQNDLAALLMTAFLSESSTANPLRLIGGISAESYPKRLNQTNETANSRFAHVINADDSKIAAGKDSALASRRTLKEAQDRSDAVNIVLETLEEKVSALTAIRREMIDPHIPVDELGLDSLNTYTMSSYIKRQFSVDLTQTQVSEARGLLALAEKIVQASSVASRLREETNVSRESPLAGASSGRESSLQSKIHEVQEFPKQPLQDLESTFLELKEGITVNSSQEDLDRLQGCFQKDRMSLEYLHQKLEKRYQDYSIENWLTNLYTRNRFLVTRSGLVPGMTYFGTHPVGVPLSQAERAAVICLAAYTFRRRLLSGQSEEIRLGSQSIDPGCQKFLFDSHRQPSSDEDRLIRHEDSRHIVVLIRGHAFNLGFPGIMLAKNLPELRDIFIDLIDRQPTEKSFLGVLTAGNRSDWNDVRQKLSLSGSELAKTIKAIESAMFVICLDDTRPATVTERYRQFLWPGSYNRWFDKTLQFVVCENGESATILEHSALDGVAMQPLHNFLHRTLSEEHSFEKSKADTVDGGLGLSFERLPMPDPDHHKDIWNTAVQILDRNVSAAKNSSMAAIDIQDLGETFLNSRRFPAQAGVQLAIQLAGRRFWGENVYSMETVSLSHFRDGRVETNPILRPAMARYLDAMEGHRNASLSADQKQDTVQLAREACREYTKYLSRASQGRGFGRHLLALEWVMDPSEETPPGLFSEPLYKYSKAAKLLTSYFPAGWREGGLLYMVPGGILVYFETKPDSICFSVFGNGVSAEQFAKELEQTCTDVSELLASEPVYTE